MSRKTNKHRTIEGLITLSKEYSSGGHCKHTTHCSLCQIHVFASLVKSCLGCPHASEHGTVGCASMNTASSKFMKFVKVITIHAVTMDTYTSKARAEYTRKAAELCRTIPVKHFTKSGWTYEAFESLHLLDQIIAKKYANYFETSYLKKLFK